MESNILSMFDKLKCRYKMVQIWKNRIFGVPMSLSPGNDFMAGRWRKERSHE